MNMKAAAKTFFMLAIPVCLLIFGVCFAIWLSLYKMLYGGIMQAVNNWGINNEEVVLGIIKAVLFEVGALPGVVVCVIAVGVGRVLMGD